MTITLLMRAKGLLYCLIWYMSILIGFYFLFAPLLPLLLLHRKTYRRFTDILFHLWETFNVSLMEIVFGVHVVLTGDAFRSEERSLVVMNHRTRVDWNFLWAALMHASNPPAHNMKLVLKKEVKDVPGLGWIMQMSRFLYIHRNWKEDESRMGRMLDYLSTTGPFQLVLFPEGTNLTARTKAKSDAFAKDNNLKPYEFVLHPRTTGFGFIADRMRQNEILDAVYDVTIAYPDIIPESEKDLSEGKIPNQVHFHVKRYGSSSVPTTLIGLEKWLQELWRDKDQQLSRFYSDCPSVIERAQPQVVWPLQYLSLCAWIVFMYWTLSVLLTSWKALLWVVATTAFMSCVGKYTDGLQEAEIMLARGEFWKQCVSALVKGKSQKRD